MTFHFNIFPIHDEIPILHLAITLEVKLIFAGLCNPESECLWTRYMNEVLIPVAPSHLSSVFPVAPCED